MNFDHALERSQWAPSNLEDIFHFFSDASNLEVLTPPWLRFQILSPQPIAMSVGALIDYRLNWRGIPLRWQTKIIQWEPPNIFEDWQMNGPYRLWHHIHTFESIDGGTLISDRVRYALPFGLLGQAVHALTVRAGVNAIFDYRSAKVCELFGCDARVQRRRS